MGRTGGEGSALITRLRVHATSSPSPSSFGVVEVGWAGTRCLQFPLGALRVGQGWRGWLWWDTGMASLSGWACGIRPALPCCRIPGITGHSDQASCPSIPGHPLSFPAFQMPLLPGRLPQGCTSSPPPCSPRSAHHDGSWGAETRVCALALSKPLDLSEAVCPSIIRAVNPTCHVRILPSKCLVIL